MTRTCARPRRHVRHLTAGRRRLYSDVAMSDTTRNELEQELRQLEARVDTLVAIIEKLKDENRSLRQRHESLSGERASLVQKNEQVRTRVEAIIGRLKTLEHGA